MERAAPRSDHETPQVEAHVELFTQAALRLWALNNFVEERDRREGPPARAHLHQEEH